jgi:integrase
MAKRKPKECPLNQHTNGQWYKKYRGRYFYFGTDLDAALKRWCDEKDYILAGKPVPNSSADPSIVELANLFIANRKNKIADGSIEARTVEDYESTIQRLIGIVGKECRPQHLRPLDFAGIKAKLAEPVRDGTHGKQVSTGRKAKTALVDKRGRQVERRSAGSVGGDIRRLRVFLNWTWKAELIPTAPRYGDEFSPPSRKEQRRKRAKDGRKDFTAEQIRSILTHCHPPMKAMVLIALNGGVGNLDLANMQFSHLTDIAVDPIVVDYPRGKTGAPRRFFLWQETAAALRDYLAVRPDPRSDAFKEIIFLTRLRHPWIRRSEKTITDSISFEFSKARKAAGFDRGAFYDLRRTFRTVAAGAMDREATDFIMGHADDAEDMGSLYTQHIDDSRVIKVVNHVRTWLFSEVAK